MFSNTSIKLELGTYCNSFNINEHMLEYEAVLKRPEHLQVGNRDIAMTDVFLDAMSLFMEPVHLHYLWRPQLRDAADEMVLETALNARADALVTMNINDFKPASHFGLRVLLPS
ncbi:MAG: PIN domain-containing protein [Methylococcales bacterium]